jgi:hypothetical protein
MQAKWAKSVCLTGPAAPFGRFVFAREFDPQTAMFVNEQSTVGLLFGLLATANKGIGEKFFPLSALGRALFRLGPNGTVKPIYWSTRELQMKAGNDAWWDVVGRKTVQIRQVPCPTGPAAAPAPAATAPAAVPAATTLARTKAPAAPGPATPAPAAPASFKCIQVTGAYADRYANGTSHLGATVYKGARGYVLVAGAIGNYPFLKPVISAGVEYASTNRYAPFSPSTLGVAICKPLRVLGTREETGLVLVAYSTDRNAALGTWLSASGRQSRESAGMQARPC